MLQAILFDLDGTLLPMDNDEFTNQYFHHLANTAANWGYHDSKLLIKAVWAGVAGMVKNPGGASNYDVFWQIFAKLMGEDSLRDIPRFNTFYDNEFNLARSATFPAPLARQAVETAREKAEHVILATNPLFPRNADATRLGWIDLTLEDFDLVTDYSNSCHCKPNPVYYQDIMAEFDLDPAKCLMVGNDAEEDMQSASSLGFPVFLITDYLINRKNLPLECPHGTYGDMVNYLKAL